MLGSKSNSWKFKENEKIIKEIKKLRKLDCWGLQKAKGYNKNFK